MPVTKICRWKRKDGRHIAVEFVGNSGTQAGVIKVIQCNIRDITKRKQIEERLKIASKELGDLESRAG